MSEVAKRLLIERANAGITIVSLSEKSSVNRNTISDIERGKRKASAKTLGALAKGLGISVEKLIGQNN